MGIKVPSLISTTKQILKQKSFNNRNQEGSPKGHVTVYVGCDEKKRHVVPISYLRDPSFQQLLNLAEEEFGFSHPMGGLTIPCSEEMFLDITCHLAN